MKPGFPVNATDCDPSQGRFPERSVPGRSASDQRSVPRTIRAAGAEEDLEARGGARSDGERIGRATDQERGVEPDPEESGFEDHSVQELPFDMRWRAAFDHARACHFAGLLQAAIAKRYRSLARQLAKRIAGRR